MKYFASFIPKSSKSGVCFLSHMSQQYLGKFQMLISYNGYSAGQVWSKMVFRMWSHH